ncbi:Flp pilus assembly protein CpaB [Noviherbaspirillum pedocola]|uniref:Flp pilus assembly protein CpaB n=1 Tax=Noviherbaspirillum pedocola TaxID=2801341 RepID=A0A934W613_9BURK|nr:Flp pilus assembly protein CpaB [Noviherbaspirillum pedocola]MBK4733813.1 Flp pilus assembly protein CpaB [Noviherbaspirillum pedocola]
MRNTRALVTMIIAVVLAFAAVVVAARWISAQAQGSTDKVAVAATDIGLGAKITPDMIRMVDWPSGSKPPGIFNDAKTLESRVTRTSITRGEPIMEGKLAPPGTQGGLSAVVAEGKRAITVRVNDVVGVAGFALPGNYVDILVNTQGEGAGANGRGENISKIVLERILVLAIAQEASRDDTKPKVVNAVTLEVTPDQAEKLDLARSVGSLSLVLRNQVDPSPVNTDGATKATLFNVKAPAQPETKPAAPRPVVKHVAVRAPRPAGTQVEVIKGLARSTQEF